MKSMMFVTDCSLSWRLMSYEELRNRPLQNDPPIGTQRSLWDTAPDFSAWTWRSRHGPSCTSCTSSGLQCFVNIYSCNPAELLGFAYEKNNPPKMCYFFFQGDIFQNITLNWKCVVKTWKLKPAVWSPHQVQRWSCRSKEWAQLPHLPKSPASVLVSSHMDIANLHF